LSKKAEKYFVAKVVFVCRKKKEIEEILKKIDEVLDEKPNVMHWFEEPPAMILHLKVKAVE